MATPKKRKVLFSHSINMLCRTKKANERRKNKVRRLRAPPAVKAKDRRRRRKRRRGGSRLLHPLPL
jgi:hypothetical protein